MEGDEGNKQLTYKFKKREIESEKVNWRCST